MKDMKGMTNNTIQYGDRIFARLTMSGRTLVEFMINCVADNSELMAELFRITKGVRGLAKLYIRNQSQGWAEERAVLLYPDSPQPKPVIARSEPAHSPKMHFPWETH
jgi:hypothetical protein